MTDKIKTINGKRYIELVDYKFVVDEALGDIIETLQELLNDIKETRKGVKKLV